jgi:hypothetical protein
MKFVSTRLMGASVVLAALLAGCGGGSDSPATTAGGTTSTGGTSTGGTSTGGTSTGGTSTGGTSTNAAAKYSGVWSSDCEGPFNDGPGTPQFYERDIITITPTSATAASFSGSIKFYTNASCTTPNGDPDESYTGTATIAGQATLSYAGSSQTFDNLDVTVPGEPPLKWTGTVLSNGRLVIDFEDGGNNGVSSTYPVDPNEGSTDYAK